MDVCDVWGMAALSGSSGSVLLCLMMLELLTLFVLCKERKEAETEPHRASAWASRAGAGQEPLMWDSLPRSNPTGPGWCPHGGWIPRSSPATCSSAQSGFPRAASLPQGPWGIHHFPMPLTASHRHPQTELTSLHQPPGDAHCPPSSLAGEEGGRTSSFSAPNSTILKGRTPPFQSKAPKPLTDFDSLPSNQTPYQQANFLAFLPFASSQRSFRCFLQPHPQFTPQLQQENSRQYTCMQSF